MILCLVALAVASGVAFLLTPFVKKLAERLVILDKPDRKRKHHRRLVPLWGGLAILIAIIFSLVGSLFLTSQGQQLLEYHTGFLKQRLPWIVAALLVVGCFGLLDDKHALPPKVKLLVQFVAVVLILIPGFYLKSIILPFFGISITFWPVIGILASLIWMLFMVNAFNFVDGLDGLASSQAVLSGLGLGLCGLILAAKSENLMIRFQCQLGSVCAVSAAGAALGFLKFNKWPAKLFLGDAGSTLLGFSLALAALLIMGLAPSPWVIISVLLFLGWPVLDTLQVIVRRLMKGNPVSKADNRHGHHELQKRGFTKTATVAFINTVSLLLGLIGLVLIWI